MSSSCLKGKKWQLATGGITESSPAIGPGGTVYIGVNKRLFAINPDGTKQREIPTEIPIDSSPAVAADGTVYFGANVFNAIKPDGNVLWHFWTSGYIHSAPIIGKNGVVYVASDIYKFFALKGASPLADAPWPMFRRDARRTGQMPASE